MSLDHFTDLGGGWFLYDDQGERLSVVCDSSTTQPDHFFGPAAWNGNDGPASGIAILEAKPVLGGRWEQTGRDEWKWYSEDGQVLEDAPDGWPRKIELRDSQANALLEAISGLVVDTQEALIEALRHVTSSLPKKEVPFFSASARLAFVKFAHPVAFGEAESSQDACFH